MKKPQVIVTLPYVIAPDSERIFSPHFSQGFYCGVTEGHVYCVALPQTPRRTIKYASGVFGRAPCIRGPLHRLATKPCEKCGLTRIPRTFRTFCPAEFVAAEFSGKSMSKIHNKVFNGFIMSWKTSVVRICTGEFFILMRVIYKF